VGAVIVFQTTFRMTVFLVPGLLKHLKRSVTEGVRLEEMGPLEDPSLLDRLRKEYGDSPVKLWAVKETLTGHWRKCGPGDFHQSTNINCFHGSCFWILSKIRSSPLTSKDMCAGS
jgi:hypothetical protein